MTARETNATIATATSKINGRLFITIPVTATSLYVLVNVTLFSFSPTKLFFPFSFNVSNASVYDGASAAAEAMAMCHNRKKKKTVISGAANPMTIQTIQTYCEGNNTEAVVVPAKDGKTDLKALMEAMDQTTSGVFIQQPSYFGQIEDAAAIGEAVHAAGAKFVMGIYPIAGAALKSPRECGADVVTGEGQPLVCPWHSAALIWDLWLVPMT